MTSWHVSPDPYGEPTLFHGDTAVFRESDFAVAGAEYRDQLWSVLTRVLAPDEATVERLAERLLAEGGHEAYASEKIREITRDDVRILLAALKDEARG